MARVKGKGSQLRTSPVIANPLRIIPNAKHAVERIRSNSSASIARSIKSRCRFIRAITGSGSSALHQKSNERDGERLWLSKGKEAANVAASDGVGLLNLLHGRWWLLSIVSWNEPLP